MIEILIWAAIIPSIILIILVLKQDKIESEPIGLLIKLFFFGALTTLPAGLLETWGEMGIMQITRDSDMQTLLMFLICVPLVEEGVKYIALATTWKHEAFNFTFDGVVYAVIVSLGFATLENILYVMNYMSLQVALVRGILSVPLHCTCGVFMGYFYGMARNHSAHGEHGRSVVERVLALIVPLFIHGLYDFALSVDSEAISLAGLGFTVVIFILSFMQVRWSSKQDAYIIGTDVPVRQPVQQAPVNQQFQQPQYPQQAYQQPQPAQPVQQFAHPQYQPVQQQYQQPVQQPQYPLQYQQPV
ncbi:MAG: PrsW family intramembrane metalloprotease, partial [Coriobacteriaceae bacterium]|nr:PrsW family intramembrane metalloprotease [Coriobacteriaceae bacterium]